MLLHTLCVPSFPLDEARAVLEAIVFHIERHPLDVMDWGMAWRGDVFIQVAARYGRLSAFFPVVRDLPFFADQVEPTCLKWLVMAEDWEALSEEDKESFTAEIVNEQR